MVPPPVPNPGLNMDPANDPLTDSKGLLNFEFKSCDDIEEEVTPSRLNAIIRAVNRNAITSVVNGWFRSNPKGKTLVCGDGSSALPGHPLSIVDGSIGAIAGIILTPGVVIDSNGSSMAWTPNIDGTPVTNNPPPVFNPGGADTVAYLDCTITTATGVITAVDFATSIALPPSTDTHFYLFISHITVEIDVTNASVRTLDDGAQGSQRYETCGVLPLVDGNSYRNWRF